MVVVVVEDENPTRVDAHIVRVRVARWFCWPSQQPSRFGNGWRLPHTKKRSRPEIGLISTKVSLRREDTLSLAHRPLHARPQPPTFFIFFFNCSEEHFRFHFHCDQIIKAEQRHETSSITYIGS